MRLSVVCVYTTFTGVLCLSLAQAWRPRGGAASTVSLLEGPGPWRQVVGEVKQASLAVVVCRVLPDSGRAGREAAG